MAWGLWLPTSNLNLQIKLKKKELSDDQKGDLSKEFVTRLAKDKTVVNDMTIESRSNILLAKIKTSAELGGLNLEVIFRPSGGGHQPKSEEVVRELLEKYPVVRAVYFALKSMIERTTFGDPNTGGLTSLSLFLMIVALVQNTDLTVSQLTKTATSTDPCPFTGPSLFGCSQRTFLTDSNRGTVEGPSANQSFDTTESETRRKSNQFITLPSKTLTSGKLLIDFLYWYGFTFNYKEFAIAAAIKSEEPLTTFPRKETIISSAFSVLHPLNRAIVTTKAFKDSEGFQQWCRLTFVNLFTRCQCKELKELARVSVMPAGIVGSGVTEALLQKAKVKDSKAEGTLEERIVFQERREKSVSNLDSFKPITRRRLSSKSQTYEAKPSTLLTLTSGISSMTNLIKLESGECCLFRRLLVSERNVNSKSG